MCLSLGRVMIPTSFIAGVMPSAVVNDVPVLCATSVPAGNLPFIRLFPVVQSVSVCHRKEWQESLKRVSL